MSNKMQRRTRIKMLCTSSLPASALSLVLSLATHACVAQTKTQTWTTHDCATCESTIINPGWYSDGSGLFTEAMQIGDGFVTTALSVSESNLVLAVGFSVEAGKSASVQPSTAITIESDSSPNMVLLPTGGPAHKLPKNDLSVKRQIKKDASLAISGGDVRAGYLFFPNDPEASSLTVIVNYNGAIYRFPFKRNPNAKAKFGYGENSTAASASNEKAHPPLTSASPKGMANSGNIAPAPTTNESNSHFVSNLTVKNAGPIPLAKSTGACVRTISFAFAEGGRVSPNEPGFAHRWIANNRSKYPGLCFSQIPNGNTANLLFVLSNSRDSFSGLYPTTRTSIATNTSPTYGNGTVSDSYGGTWNYNYTGNVTTTTTTVSQIDLAYTDTTNMMFIYVYDSNGALLSRHERSITTRQGGDGANTAGYNLGAALGAIHLRERLLKEAVSSVSK